MTGGVDSHLGKAAQTGGVPGTGMTGTEATGKETMGEPVNKPTEGKTGGI